MATRTELNNRVVREISATSAEIEAFTLRLDKFLSKNLRGILKGVLSGDVQGLEAAAILGGIEQSLVAAGLQKELQKLELIYGKRLQDVRSQLQASGKKGEVLTSADFQLAETLITFDTTKVANRITEYVDDISGTLMRGVITGQVPDFQNIQDNFGDSLTSDLNTELNTLTSGFYQSVITKKADDLGLELYLYLGPEDKVTRDFCQHVLDGNLAGFDSRSVPIYSIDEIKQMDNEQGLDVLVYKGGYNCRHQWSPVSDELAAQLGYNRK